MTTSFPRARVVGSSLAVVSCLALSTTAAAQAAPAPTVLDAGRVLAIAGDGDVVAWLHADYGPKGGEPTKITLWTRDAAGTARQVQQTLPRNTSDLAIGSDGKGHDVVVLNAGGTAKSGPDTLYALSADGKEKPHRLKVSAAKGAESAPGLHDGVLSFSREERTRTRGVVHATVRLGSLTSSRSRIVSDGKKGTDVVGTAPTAGSGVAYVTQRLDDTGGSYDLRVLRSGHASKKLLHTGFGGASDAGFGTLVTTSDGRELIATRWCDDGGGHPSDRTTFKVPAGTEVGATAKLQPGEQDLGVPVQGGSVYVDYDLPAGDNPTGELVFQPTG